MQQIDASARTGDRSYLRRRNSLSILEHLWNSPATVTDIAKSTSLSRTAAESVLGDLVEAGWVEVGRPSLEGTQSPGRPASVYRFIAGVGYVAGIDIGAHHVSAAIADLAGNRLATVTVAVEESSPASERISRAVSALTQAQENSDVAPGSIWALTVGSPGVIDDGRVIHFGGEGMPGWIGLDIAAEFSRITDAVVRVEGDSALGAVAEMAHGAAAGANDVVYILSGVRTGAAIAIDRVLRRGHSGGAGLIGELPELRWRDIEHERYGMKVYPDGRPTRDQIFDLAGKGDAVAVAAIHDFADALALGASAMVLAIDPQMVIIGGPNAQHADVFIERFISQLGARCPTNPTVAVSALGSDAVVGGSIQLGLDAIRRALREAIESQPTFPLPHTGMQNALRLAR
ncbi:MAG: ROK family transcriptional regulator [Microbacteriaceae bacterium]